MTDPMAEILAALDLPPAALRRWLDDLTRFAHAHGEHRYRELLALLAACRAAQEPDA